MRAIVSGAVSLRQLVFHPSAGHPLAGRGLQRSSSASLYAEKQQVSAMRQSRTSEH
jgi:hypothetical protein